MAAVLFVWSESDIYGDRETEENPDLFEPALTTNAYKKKMAAIEKLVRNAKEEDVFSFLTTILAENEKLLFRFYSIVNKKTAKENINNYIRQIDVIARRYLGRNDFISYDEADDFIWELNDIIKQIRFKRL